MPRWTPSVKMFISTDFPRTDFGLRSRAEGRKHVVHCTAGALTSKIILLAFAQLMYPDAIQSKV
jgi:hypothetical protein